MKNSMNTYDGTSKSTVFHPENLNVDVYNPKGTLQVN